MSDVKPVGSSKAAYKRRQLPAQAGQALTEFLVVALALIPLFLLIPMIAKYQDIGHSTQMASRYAAFEATIRNDAHGAFKTDANAAKRASRVAVDGCSKLIDAGRQDRCRDGRALGD